MTFEELTKLAVKNTVIANFGDSFLGVTPDYCVSDDGDGTNSLGPVSLDWDNEFVDANNGDFTPIEGGNILVAGQNDPGSGLFSTDIIGASYVTDSWSRGAYAGAASTGQLQIFFFSKDYRHNDYWRNFLQDGIHGEWKMAA